MNKLVSVIVPVYNVESYLHQCVDSILSQSYRNLEIILVDDGSTDSSGKICDMYAQKNTNIIVCHKTNGGLSSARNVGIDKSTGEFLAFLDSDDYITSNMIEELVLLQNSSSADVVGCESAILANGEEHIIPHYHNVERITEYAPNDFLKDTLLIKADCSCCNKMFKRSVIGEKRFEEGRTNEDILFLFNVLPHINKLVQMNDCYYKYRYNANSISHVFNIKSMDVLYNAIEINRIIALKRLNDLLPVAAAYLFDRAFFLAKQIRASKGSERLEYQGAFKIAKGIVLSNIFYLFFQSHYSLKTKLSIVKFFV